MIGDVLYDAIQELERYQREMPDSYDDMRDEIEACKNAMRKLRRKLDLPPDVLDPLSPLALAKKKLT